MYLRSPFEVERNQGENRQDFNKRNKEEYHENLKSKEVEFDKDEDYSKEFMDLVKGLLNREPSDRAEFAKNILDNIAFINMNEKYDPTKD